MAAVTIRPAVVADAEAIAGIRIAAWQATYSGIVARSFLDAMSVADDTARRQVALADPAPGRFTLVATRANATVGFASGGPDRDGLPASGELYAIYVEPAQVGTGVGAALFPAVLGRLAAAGYRHAGLWVAEANARARRFYERFGMRATGERRTLDAGGPVPEVRYGIRLSAAWTAR